MSKSFFLKYCASCVIVSLIFGAFVFLICYYLTEIPKWNELITNGKKTTAVVKKVDDDSRTTIRFVYELEGNKYTGLGSLHYAGYRRGELIEGDSITIIYNPAKPQEGFFLNPASKKDSAYLQVWFITASAIIFFVWLPFLGFGIVYSKTNRLRH